MLLRYRITELDTTLNTHDHATVLACTRRTAPFLPLVYVRAPFLQSHNRRVRDDCNADSALTLDGQLRTGARCWRESLLPRSELQTPMGEPEV